MENIESSEHEGEASKGHAQTESGANLVRLHLLIGWWSLLTFLSLGIVLEYMHAFRVPWYVNVGPAETRRLMWTLAHAHGVLISLVHVAFAVTMYLTTSVEMRSKGLASGCLIAAGILMPFGFFLGGLFIYEGDPGLGVYLVPPGALLLFVAVCMTGTVVTRGSVKNPKEKA